MLSATGDDDALIEYRGRCGSRVIANGVEDNCLAKPWSPPADARRGRFDADWFQAAGPLPAAFRRSITASTNGYHRLRLEIRNPLPHSASN